MSRECFVVVVTSSFTEWSGKWKMDGIEMGRREKRRDSQLAARVIPQAPSRGVVDHWTNTTLATTWVDQIVQCPCRGLHVLYCTVLYSVRQSITGSQVHSMYIEHPMPSTCFQTGSGLSGRRTKAASSKRQIIKCGGGDRLGARKRSLGGVHAQMERSLLRFS